MSGQLQGFRVYEIDVGGRNGENDTIRLRNVLGDEVSSLFFNVCRLISDWDLQLLARFCHKSR